MLTPSTIITGQFDNDLHQYLNRLLQPLGNQLAPNNPDLLRIDSTTGWGIDQVRQIHHFLSQKPFNHDSKLVIIFEAHHLNVESQNALLKTLEEPPLSCYLILITPNPQSLLPTIRSRCQILQPNLTRTQSTAPILQPLAKISQNLELSDQLSVNKDEVLPYLESQLHLYKQRLVENPSPNIHSQIQRLIKTVNMVKSNVDPKSAIDFFLLST